MALRTLTSIALLALTLTAHAADDLVWQFHVEPATAKAGDQAELVFSAEIPSGSILYSSDFKTELGPRPAKFTFDPTAAVELEGSVKAIKAKRRKDKSFGGEYTYFAEHAEFRQKIRVVQPGATVKGHIDAQSCEEKTGLCFLLKKPFEIQL